MRIPPSLSIPVASNIATFTVVTVSRACAETIAAFTGDDHLVPLPGASDAQ